MLAIFSSTYLLKPSISDTTTITVATPKITPSKVRNERSLCAQMASTASFIDSKIFIAKRSSQCFTNYTLRCSMKQDEYWREIRRMRSGERFQFNSLFIQLRLAGSRPDNEPKPLAVRGFYCCRFSRYARLMIGSSFTLSSVPGSSGTLEIIWTLFNPWITSPKTVYLPFQSGLGRRQMKNWLDALFGSPDRAAPTVPRTYGRVLNSAGTLG